MMTFWAKVKTSVYSKRYYGYFWGNFCKNLGYFFVEHLVTLKACFDVTYHGSQPGWMAIKKQ